MNPWTVIGWIVLSVISVFVFKILLKILRVPFILTFQFIWHLKTRNDTPEKGQTWMGSGYTYHVDRVENDNVILKSGRTSFGHSIEEWKKFVRTKRLRRVSP